MADLLSNDTKNLETLSHRRTPGGTSNSYLGGKFITVLVPDSESQEWKEVRLTQEFEDKGCNSTNTKRQGPQIRRFLEHHIVDACLFKEGKKRKTKSGNKSWWGEVGSMVTYIPRRSGY